MIVVTVFHSILNQMEFYLVQNRMENCRHDHIPFNVKGNEIIVFSVYAPNIYIYIQSSVKYDQIWNVITLFRLIWRRTELRLIPYQPEKCNYNPNSI